MPASKIQLSPNFFAFLKDLEKNNNKAWFEKNKKRYEGEIKEPLLEVIANMQAILNKTSKHFLAIPKAVGGSMSRIYRDTRFGKDKTPYHTHMMISFAHEAATKTKPQPKIYVRFAPGDCGIGFGFNSQDTKDINQIRQAIVDNPREWKKALAGKALGGCGFYGDALKKAPKGFDPDHPLIEDIKRKSFVITLDMTQKEVTTDLGKAVGDRFKAAKGLMKFLCDARGVEF